MRVLALDSTTRVGSVALLETDAGGAATIVDERAGDAARTHAERLPADVTALLDAHDLSSAAIDLFAVASGPGSFTGLRIGIATMQGFALACDRPLIGVSALDALAEMAMLEVEDGAAIGVWIDAYRREVFTALYRVEASANAGGERLSTLEGPRVGDADSTLRRWTNAGTRPAIVIGGGAVLYAEAVVLAFPQVRIIHPPVLAGAVGRIAARYAAGGLRPHPAALQPLYVRRPDAEVARDHAAGVRRE
jgi:tRNA threonylcarbamoyladenosine biosynthesis protein TsaB